jgi:hypothetical protein
MRFEKGAQAGVPVPLETKAFGRRRAQQAAPLRPKCLGRRCYERQNARLPFAAQGEKAAATKADDGRLIGAE